MIIEETKLFSFSPRPFKIFEFHFDRLCDSNSEKIVIVREFHQRDIVDFKIKTEDFDFWMKAKERFINQQFKQ